MGQLDPECGGGVTIVRRHDLERGGSPFVFDMTVMTPGDAPVVIGLLSKSDLQRMRRVIGQALKTSGKEE